MLMYEKILRLKRQLPQLGWVERLLYAVSELIQRHQRGFEIKDIWGQYVANPPFVPYWSSEVSTQTYSQLVAVMGCGHSGSGAVLDLLAEYDGVSTFYNHELDSGNQNQMGVEFEILRHSGGLFMLEKAVTEQYEAQQDAVVKQFLNLCEWLYKRIGGPYNKRFLQLTREFLDSILLARIPTPQSKYYTWIHCPHLSILGTGGDRLIWGGNGAIYLLRKMSVKEYRTLAQKYITSILRGIKSLPILVLDQMLQDSFCDIDRYLDYVGPFKAIYSIRDPRDVYVTGSKLGALWIPRDPRIFVKWFLDDRGVGRCKSLSHPNALVIHFEDLVMHYENTVRKIETYLGLSPNQHIHSRKFFDPSVSRKNVGSFNMFEDQSAIRYIEKSLPNYCYQSIGGND